MNAAKSFFDILFLPGMAPKTDWFSCDLSSVLVPCPQHAKLPKGVDSYEKFERKAAKLIDCIELELEERA